jgi:hypothetical protein
MKHDHRNRRDNHHDQKKHDCDEPCNAAFVLRSGLRDSEGVDEGAGEVQEGAHGDWMLLKAASSRFCASVEW